MPNLYPYYDLGTWESYITNAEYFPSGSNQRISLQKSALEQFAGSYSGKMTLISFLDTIGVRWVMRGNAATGNIRPILTLTPGAKYKASCRVYVDPLNPIATDDAPIALGPNANPPVVDAPGEPVREIIFTTVGAAKGVWQEISYTFIEQPGTTSSYQPHLLQIFTTDTPSLQGITYSGHIVRAGTCLEGGVMYIDNYSIEQLPPDCDLEFGDPAYTKTDETGVDLNDGTLTAFADHANPDSPYTPQYSINGVDFQLSNQFTGIAPGDYTLTVKDESGTCIISTPFTIVAFDPPPPPPPPPSGDLVVDSEPVNKYNFISWFSAVGDLGFTGFQCENCCWDIPKGYNEDRDLARIHAPIMARNENNAFYINFDTPLTDPTFADFRLGLINAQGVVKLDIGTLMKHDVTLNNYNIYCSPVIIPADVVDGIYRMMIYRVTNEEVLFISNAIEVMSQDRAKCESVQVFNRHGYNIYKYYYELFDDTYLNMIRLRLYRVDENAEGDLSQYRATSSGRLRNVSFELDKFITLESYWFDDLAHRAMMVLQACGVIVINNKYYLPKALYKWEFDAGKNLTKGRIDLYEQDFSTANRYKPLNEITIVGSEDPLLLGNDGGRILL